MFARVRLITRDEQDALVVPEQAIVPQGDEQFVFRVVDGKAIRAKVDVGQRRDGVVEVVKGLAPADMVVTAGQLKIRDGTPVTVAAATPPSSSLAAPALPAAAPPVARNAPGGTSLLPPGSRPRTPRAWRRPRPRLRRRRP